MTRVGEGAWSHVAYNVYTKPLWADKSETIYRARESEAMKYVAEEAMKQAGIAYATEQIIDLIAKDVTHIHIYTMNRPDIAGSIMTNLSKIIDGYEAE